MLLLFRRFLHFPHFPTRFPLHSVRSFWTSLIWMRTGLGWTVAEIKITVISLHLHTKWHFWTNVIRFSLFVCHISYYKCPSRTSIVHEWYCHSTKSHLRCDMKKSKCEIQIKLNSKCLWILISKFKWWLLRWRLSIHSLTCHMPLSLRHIAKWYHFAIDFAWHIGISIIISCLCISRCAGTHLTLS